MNKTLDLFNKREVVLSGGSANDKKAKAVSLRRSLEKVTVPSMSDVERAGFNVRLPKIYEALLKIDSSSYIQSLGSEDVENLADIGVELAVSDGRPGIAFRVVFGATEQMPLRALSYILPPLLTMERIKGADGSVPQLQIVFAHHISSRLNRLDSERVFGESLKFAQIAKYYVEEFFPQLDRSTIFLEDTTLRRGSFLREELVALAGKFSNISEELKSVVSEKGDGSGRLNPYYAAAHALMHDRDGFEYLRPIVPNQPEYVNPSSIVSFGGLQENLFYKVRHSMKPYLDLRYNSVNTFQYFTRHHVPPYYMARGGDVALADVIELRVSQDKEISVSAMHDLDYLQGVSDGRRDLYEFLKKTRRI